MGKLKGLLKHFIDTMRLEMSSIVALLRKKKREKFYVQAREIHWAVIQ